MRPLLIASVLALGACDVGEVPIGGGGGTVDGGGDTARSQSFDSMIKPLVTECAVAACHGGVQMPILTSYDAMVAGTNGARYIAKPGASNILVTKGGTTGTHSGIPYLTAGEQSTVASWIDGL